MRSADRPSPLPAEDVLATIGLEPAELTAYDLVLAAPGSSIAELQPRWRCDGSLRLTVRGLVDKGLVEVLAGRPQRFKPNNPAVVLEEPLLHHRRELNELHQTAKSLAQQRLNGPTARPRDAVAEAVVGDHAVAQTIQLILRQVHRRVRTLNQPANPVNAQLAAGQAALLERGVDCSVLYDRTSLRRDDVLQELDRLTSSGQQSRVLPVIPLPLCVVDAQCAILPFEHQTLSTQGLVLVHPSSLLDALTALFDGLWERALPVQMASAGARARQRGSSDDENQRIISLLLSGVTDEVVARQLGISNRTLQRRISQMMSSLGVHTRFQMGIQAALRDRSALDKRVP